MYMSANATGIGCLLQVTCSLGSSACTDKIAIDYKKLRHLAYLQVPKFRSFNTKLNPALCINFYISIWIAKLCPWGKHILNKNMRMIFGKISLCGVAWVLSPLHSEGVRTHSFFLQGNSPDHQTISNDVIELLYLQAEVKITSIIKNIENMLLTSNSQNRVQKNKVQK